MLRFFIVLCVGLTAAGHCYAKDNPPPLTLFAAASLADVLDDLALQFSNGGGVEVVVALGASSTMARQIEAGAPAHIFASAHPLWVEYLRDRDLLIDGTAVQPASTELVLIAPADSSHSFEGTPFAQQLMGLLGLHGYLAIGDPAHVPAGIYAQQVLRSAGLWNGLENRVARAENVRAALALVSRGEAAAGLVYRTDVQLDDVALVAAVPRALLPPVRYQFAGIRQSAHPATRNFLQFLMGATGQAIFRQHGFVGTTK
jgi:molybdate transport system substrate-binding protein